jgi:murein DD-endopeptidase MepM/ murein hydrolase activator NlpD
MIAVLQHQSITRRGSNGPRLVRRDSLSPWRLHQEGFRRAGRGRDEGARSRPGLLSRLFRRRPEAGARARAVRIDTRLRGASAPSERLVKVRQHVERRRPPAGFSVPRPRARTPSGPSRLAAAVLPTLRSPWLVGGLALVLLAVLFAPALAVRSLPAPRVGLPGSPDAARELYRVVIPEEPQGRPAASSSPGVLRTLSVTSYRMRDGEGISQAAQRLHLNVDTLVSYNAIRDARSLPSGTVLRVPNGNGLLYTVRGGDSLEMIARSFSVPLEAILDWNSLKTGVIRSGQEIFVPGARMRPQELNRILGNLFVFPVAGRISSRFGERSDPFTGVERFHNGVDIVNSPGTAIGAAMAGTVRSVGFNSNYGRYVILSHGGGFQSMYAHLSRAVVSPGSVVRQGEKIGELGSTGYSTGPHLHFSIFKGGEPVDPLRYLK